jgi:hypothetical protein
MWARAFKDPIFWKKYILRRHVNVSNSTVPFFNPFDKHIWPQHMELIISANPDWYGHVYTVIKDGFGCWWNKNKLFIGQFTKNRRPSKGKLITDGEHAVSVIDPYQYPDNGFYYHQNTAEGSGIITTNIQLSGTATFKTGSILSTIPYFKRTGCIDYPDYQVSGSFIVRQDGLIIIPCGTVCVTLKDRRQTTFQLKVAFVNDFHDQIQKKIKELK